jgi:putative salt-induced outer membrane protein YdiY
MDFSSLTDYRYEGWAVGAGIAYGYAFILNKHWNFELEIGAGYIYTENDKFECIECGKRLAEDVPFHYFGPTKAAINFVYLF